MAFEQNLDSNDGQALPTLLNARSRQPLAGGDRSSFWKPNMEIAIPEPSNQHAYPSEAVCVRNTFIHVASPIAENVTKGRSALSCPSSHIGRIQDSFKADVGVSNEVSAVDQKQVLVLEHALFDPVPDTPEASFMGRAGLMPCYGSQGKLGQHSLYDISSCQPASCPPAATGCGSSLDWNPCIAGGELFYTADHHIHHSLPGSLSEPFAPQTTSQMAGMSLEAGFPTPANPAYAPLHATASLHSAPPGFELKPPMVDRPYAQQPSWQLAPGEAPKFLTLKPSLQDIPVCPPNMPSPSEPAPGSAALPSIGSREHFAGECKPCAFLHTKGCNDGAMCRFCHICEAGEKKRRQKAKKALFNKSEC